MISSNIKIFGPNPQGIKNQQLTIQDVSNSALTIEIWKTVNKKTVKKGLCYDDNNNNLKK